MGISLAQTSPKHEHINYTSLGTRTATTDSELRRKGKENMFYARILNSGGTGPVHPELVLTTTGSVWCTVYIISPSTLATLGPLVIFGRSLVRLPTWHGKVAVTLNLFSADRRL